MNSEYIKKLSELDFWKNLQLDIFENFESKVDFFNLNGYMLWIYFNNFKNIF